MNRSAAKEKAEIVRLVEKISEVIATEGDDVIVTDEIMGVIETLSALTPFGMKSKYGIELECADKLS